MNLNKNNQANVHAFLFLFVYLFVLYVQHVLYILENIHARQLLLSAEYLMLAVELGKFMKLDKVVLVPHGGQSRHKANTVKNIGEGTTKHPYSHALVAGIDCQPSKNESYLGKKKVTKTSKIKLFVKVYSHIYLVPTRYSMGILWDKTVVNKEVFGEAGSQGQI